MIENFGYDSIELRNVIQSNVGQKNNDVEVDSTNEDVIVGLQIGILLTLLLVFVIYLMFGSR